MPRVLKNKINFKIPAFNSRNNHPLSAPQCSNIIKFSPEYFILYAFNTVPNFDLSIDSKHF